MGFDQNKYVNEFKKQNYDRITILVPKGKKAELQDYAKCNDISLSRLIMLALEEKTQIDLSMKSEK